MPVRSSTRIAEAIDAVAEEFNIDAVDPEKQKKEFEYIQTKRAQDMVEPIGTGRGRGRGRGRPKGTGKGRGRGRGRSKGTGRALKKKKNESSISKKQRTKTATATAAPVQQVATLTERIIVAEYMLLMSGLYDDYIKNVNQRTKQ